MYSRSLNVALLGFLFCSCGDGLRSETKANTDSAPPSVPRDAMVGIAPPSCDGVLQTGCETGFKCALAQQKWQCIPDGTREEFQSCQTPRQGDNCLAGLHCYQGVCNSVCTNNSHCSDKDTCVAIAVQGAAVAICLPPCAPLLQDCPDLANGQRQGCYLHISGASVCASVSSNPPIFPGQPCNFLNECAVGAGCVTDNGQSICRAYCSYDTFPDQSAPQCFTEDRCEQLGSLIDVGVCQ